jgi:hypothetical protein
MDLSCLRLRICFRVFERIRYYFGNSSESIPMSFVLGFYVSLVVKRWWEQYKLLPWPDNLALFISAAIPGNVSANRSSHAYVFKTLLLGADPRFKPFYPFLLSRHFSNVYNTRP